MPVPAPDEELWTRQAVLRAEADQILSELELAGLFDDVGPPLPAGSYVSGLMCWRDLDLMVLAGPDFAPRDVLHLLQRIVEVPGVVGFDYRDERGPRSPTGQARDERYHVPVTLLRGGASWRIDLTLWLHDPHANVTAWHEALRYRSRPSSAERCYASRMSGTGGPSTPTRSVGWRFTPQS